MGSNSKTQNVWLTCERIMLTFGLFFLFFFFFHGLFYFFFFYFFPLTTYNGWASAQDIGGFCFYYGHASSDCTSGCIAMSSYWTTLEYDEWNVVFHGVCWHGIKNSQHVEVWKGDGIHEESTFWELFWKDVSAMDKVKLVWHICWLNRVVSPSLEQKNSHMRENNISLLKLK